MNKVAIGSGAWMTVAYLVRWGIVLALLSDVMAREVTPIWQRVLLAAVLAGAVGLGIPRYRTEAELGRLGGPVDDV